ncbi:cytochrome c biogenesis CcdA family protein [Cellulosilyticum sp. I15G10I2]|uniref:cytochrome c biogenesis CcdA family protein n=1 Tax=Cellulosilyticum sp. I15G10I2 TaxID=1892843 RepID=UPI001FA7C28C|nr:cytochrome c biogenesis protein CcdA [Cellulosilyticum sp. I15G10I2]
MIETLLQYISEMIMSNVWIAPIMALAAGVITSFSPCCLSSIPLVIGYVGGTGGNDTKRAFRLSLTFAAGSAITFTVLGTIASIIGKLMGRSASWWYILLGILMTLMALQILEIYEFIPSTYLMSKSTRKGYLGAFSAGVLGGIFSSPCATPILIVLLALVAQKGSLIWGVMLLLLYAIGHSTLVLIAGTSVGFVKKLTSSNKYGKFNRIIKIVMGVLILAIGFYMFYLGF